MYKIFKADKYGVWLKDKNKNIILIERDKLKYTEESLLSYLVYEGIDRVTAKQVIRATRDHQRRVYSI